MLGSPVFCSQPWQRRAARSIARQQFVFRPWLRNHKQLAEHSRACILLRLKGLGQGYQVLREHWNEAAARAIDVGYEQE